MSRLYAGLAHPAALKQVRRRGRPRPPRGAGAGAAAFVGRRRVLRAGAAPARRHAWGGASHRCSAPPHAPTLILPPSAPQAVLAAHPGVLEALAASADNLTPPTAALQLAWLEAELPPLLTDVAPGGNSVLAAVSPGLAPLLGELWRVPRWKMDAHKRGGVGFCTAHAAPEGALRRPGAGCVACAPAIPVHRLTRQPSCPAPRHADRAADCCEAALDDRQPARAAAIALAALSLASRLRFGCGASAAPYASAAMRCKQALKAAYDAGADITEEVRGCAACAPLKTCWVRCLAALPCCAGLVAPGTLVCGH